MDSEINWPLVEAILESIDSVKFSEIERKLNGFGMGKHKFSHDDWGYDLIVAPMGIEIWVAIWDLEEFFNSDTSLALGDALRKRLVRYKKHKDQKMIEQEYREQKQFCLSIFPLIFQNTAH